MPCGDHTGPIFIDVSPGSQQVSGIRELLRDILTPRAMANSQILDTLRAAIVQNPPFCIGTVPIHGDEATLFYKQGENASWLDLAHAPERKVEALAQACKPATFGMNQDDVLDESYRKAGKMDLGDFKFDVSRLGIVDYVRGQLLDADESKVVRAELYKLNVYEKDSFFKSHKDTPRGDTMFGSLVVVFPTRHEGGALVLRHFGQEWTFNSSGLTHEHAQPSVAYIAFYSDVDHEVTTVRSGHRVTLTYNLFCERKPSSESLPSPVAPAAYDHLLHTALSAALADCSFLPQGGYLGFGLSFKYPIEDHNFLENIPLHTAEALKGSDGMIDWVTRQLSLATSLHVAYEHKGKHVLVQRLLIEEEQIEGPDPDILRGLTEETYSQLDPYNGKVVHEIGKELPTDNDREPYKNTIDLAWVTPLTPYSRLWSPFVVYVNEPLAACIYGDLCLVVQVGPYGRRGTA